MKRFSLLFVVLGILCITRIYATGITAGGCRFYDNPKTDLSEKSFFRKLLLLGKRKDDNKVFEKRLKTYQVAPFAISFILFCFTIVLYALYGLSFLFEFPVGVTIGSILESVIARIVVIGWYILVAIYFAILHHL